MKILVVNGSPRKGNTYKATNLFIDEMKKSTSEVIEVEDIFLPVDLPEFCTGCMNCIEKGEEKCPHSKFTMPILEKFRKADAFIFTSPVFVLSLSGGMKNFLDHFAYLFIVHRPMKEMFNKKAFIISTTAGGGTKNVIKTIRDVLVCWGINRVNSLGIALWEVDWDHVNNKRKEQMESKIKKSAKKFLYEIHGKKRRPYLFQLILEILTRKLRERQNEDVLDKKYWTENGWLVNDKSMFKNKGSL